MSRLLLTGLLLLCSFPVRAEFRAAAAKVDITPSTPQWLLGYGARKSTGVLDHLYHRIVVLDDGKTQFVLASSDLCLVSPSEYDRVAAMVQARFGLPPVQFWWGFTHTHSAPEVGPAWLPAVFMGDRYQHDFDHEYAALVAEKMLEGIAQARAALRPAKVAIGQGVSFANINRRARDLDGQTTVGLNPDGPADRRVFVLRLEAEDGALLALVANYPIHGTVLNQVNLGISADVPGIVAEYVEQKLGAPMLFMNGAAGDMAPIYSVYANPRSGHLGQFRLMLGDRIIEAARRASPIQGDPTLEAGALTVETPRKDGIGWPEDLGAYLRRPETGRLLVRVPVRTLRIGRDTAIWSAPLELFCEVAMGVRERSPFPNTLYFGYTNGWLGYLPSEKEWPYGGYETQVSPFTPQAVPDLTSAILERLGRLKP